MSGMIEVDAVHLLVGEHEPAVDDDDVVAVFEDVHVLADLPHPAERDDAERRVQALGRRTGSFLGWHGVPWCGLEEGELVDVGGVGRDDGGGRRGSRGGRVHGVQGDGRAGIGSRGGSAIPGARRDERPGRPAMSSKARRFDRWYRAAPGGTWRGERVPRARSPGSAGRIVPWTGEILVPGQEAGSCENCPSGDHDGRVQDLELARSGRVEQASISSGCGSRLSGRPALHDVRDEHVRARPADGLDAASTSRSPGAPDERPPFAVLVARPGPRRRTRPRCPGRPRRARPCVRVSCSRQRVQSRTSAAMDSSAARRSTSVTPWPPRGAPGLGTGARRGPRRG